MKKLKIFIYCVIVFVLSIEVEQAASLSVSASKRNVVVGGTTTITVNASGAAGWEYCLSYDSSMFSLTSSNSDTKGDCVRTGSTLTGYGKVTFTLKAKKSGTATVGLRDAVMYGDDGNAVDSSKGSVTIVAKTQAEIEASYSTDADLRDLNVEGYELTPVFGKEILEYSLTVPNDVETIRINAVKSDSAASVKGAGDVSLTEGSNKFEIVVTAEKGNTKTYVLSVTREELNPIFVSVNGNQLSVVRKSDAMESPAYYTATTVTIDDVDVPAFESEITGFTLVGLKDEEGNIELYIYDNGNYKLYKQVVIGDFVFVPFETDEVIDGFEKAKTISVLDNSLDVFCGEDDNFCLVYGMNVATGNKTWYMVDVEEGTFQRYNYDFFGKLVQDVKDYLLFVIIFAGGLGLSILVNLILLINNSKAKKKNKKLLAILQDNQGSEGNSFEEEEMVEVSSDDESDDSDEDVEDEVFEEDNVDLDEDTSNDGEDLVEVSEEVSEDTEEIVVEVPEGKKRGLDLILEKEAQMEKKTTTASKKKKKIDSKEQKRAVEEFLSDDTVEQSVFDEYKTESVPVQKTRRKKRK